MSKTAINKEIVLMRQTVRQVRLRVVRKLIKEIKMLRSKHGTEKQRQKYKRKADRLSEEVLAVKKMKDDDISKFAITNAQSQREVLADANVRVMIKLARHTILLDRVIEFKEKFQNYEEHLGPGRKKLMALKWKAEKKLKRGTIKGEEQELGNDRKNVTNNRLDNNGFSYDNSDENEDITNVESRREPIQDEIDTFDIKPEDNDDTSNDGSSTRAKCNLETKGTLKIEPVDLKSKVKDTISVKNKCTEKVQVDQCIQGNVEKELLDEIEAPEPKFTVKRSKPVKIVVNKEATVKRFTEFLQEENVQSCLRETIETESTIKIELEREVDSFFVTGNGESEYLSVVVPKSKTFEEDSNENESDGSRNGLNGHKFSNGRNKFFINVDKYSGNNEKFMHDKSGNKRNGWSGNEGSYEKKRSRRELSYEKNFKGEDKKNGKSDENIHPSWEAKKKQQEILKQGFQGKKIIFNDD